MLFSLPSAILRSVFENSLKGNGNSKGSSMPRKRPRDFSQAAKLVIDVATGQVEDREPTPEEQGKDPAAAALGRKGGRARSESLTPGQRSKIAQKAAKSRWKDRG
jgi:hypothetical protein